MKKKTSVFSITNQNLNCLTRGVEYLNILAFKDFGFWRLKRYLKIPQNIYTKYVSIV